MFLEIILLNNLWFVRGVFGWLFGWLVVNDWFEGLILSLKFCWIFLVIDIGLFDKVIDLFMIFDEFLCNLCSFEICWRKEIDFYVGF